MRPSSLADLAIGGSHLHPQHLVIAVSRRIGPDQIFSGPLRRPIPRPQPRTKPRPAAGETPPAYDEANRNSDELSRQSVIYRLASRARRGTIGGGSAEGGTPSISIWPEMAEFRRPSHMGFGKTLSRPKKVPRGGRKMLGWGFALRVEQDGNRSRGDARQKTG